MTWTLMIAGEWMYWPCGMWDDIHGWIHPVGFRTSTLEELAWNWDHGIRTTY